MSVLQYRIQARHDLSPTDIDAIEDQLYDHNRRVTGRDDGERLAFVLRNETDRLIGAAIGYSWAGTAELKQLWVDEAHRQRGHGSQLLNAFVTEAAHRQVRQIWVVSFSFQAPSLYEKAGFERVAEFAGWPEGHSNIVLRKFVSTCLT